MRKRLSQVLTVSIFAALLSGLMLWHNHAVKTDTLRVLCSAAAEVCEAWRQDYTALSGQNIEMKRLPTYEAISRMQLFKDKPEFDVWQGGPLEGYVQAQNQNLLQGYRAKDVNEVNPQWRDASNQWTGIYLGVLCFCVNTDTLQKIGAKVPYDWDDLLDSRFRGQISMSTPTSSGTAFTMVASQISRLGSEKSGFDYLRKLDANILQYTKSGVAPANVAARGEVAVGLAFDSHCERAKKTHNSPLLSIYPRSGTGYEIGGVALIKGSRHRSLAQSYVDYAISLRSQQQGMRLGITQYPTRSDSGYSLQTFRTEKHLVNLNPRYWAKQRNRLITRFQTEIRGREHHED